ncbi:alpha/beta hydrolase [Streptomyces sp. NPDC005571]|uniref:alpha/beta fold hydrolase n=1 Tax=Streptomyces sp. NPDC005571 TaxID=3156888 RepID=UPI00339F89BD
MAPETQLSDVTDTGTLAALAALVAAVRQLEGLTRQVGPFALPDGTCDQAPEQVAAVCRALDVPLTFDSPGHDHALASLAAGIRRAQSAPALAGLRPARAADEARRIYAEENAELRTHSVSRPDGSTVLAVESGARDAPCVVMSSACAMSYRLCLPWLEALATDYRCIVIQTRGTGEPVTDPADFDRYGSGVAEQAGDILAVMDALDTGPVHLMGLCGGAVPALVAAAREPGRVRSLSLWHADLELGPDAEKSEHQTNLRALLDMAGESRDMAGWMRDKLASGPMKGVPDSIGPLAVRPYATTELFYRYAKLTGATMHWDSRATANQVKQPTLIVTSRDDHTAHPAGSRRLAQLLPGSRLVVTDHGSHLDAFNGTSKQVGTLISFLRSLE